MLTEFDEALPADAELTITIGQLDAALRDARLELADEDSDNTLAAAYQAGGNEAAETMHRQVIERGTITLPE